MRLAIVTDAWLPQVNGVVTTLAAVTEWLREQGHDVEVIHPGDFPTMPCPGYPEIRLATRGLERLVVWDRGADTRVFHPAAGAGRDPGLERPLFLFVGGLARHGPPVPGADGPGARGRAARPGLSARLRSPAGDNRAGARRSPAVP
ncbi:MAG: hypothetical protein U5K43_03395 [Halofilum sp. (in: g-proteobacteria)]|nr:hypothetical protein [Halofilum sp. (in: g-proteobacteria)]